MNTHAANRREEGFAQIVSEVHGHVDFTPPEQMVRALCSSVPIELLTYIMGPSESTVHRWASGDVADVTDMSLESERRLAAAYEILELIDRFEAPWRCRDVVYMQRASVGFRDACHSTARRPVGGNPGCCAPLCRRRLTHMSGRGEQLAWYRERTAARGGRETDTRE